MYGKFRFDWIVVVYLPIIILTPCYTYYMCVIKNKECRAGHSTITQTANHYPQNTYFRFVMGIGATVLVLAFNTLFRWINTQAQRTHFPTMSKALYYATMLAMFFYCIAVETIDGLSNGPLHTPSAVIFFLTFEIAIIYITLYLYRLKQWDSSVISQGSLLVKICLGVYVTIVWVYCLYRSMGGEDKLGLGKTDYTVVVEWNAYLINLLWILSFAAEWRQIKVCLICK